MTWRRAGMLFGLGTLAACQQVPAIIPPALPDRIDYALNAGGHSWSVDRSGNVRVSDVEDRNGAALVVTREIHVTPRMSPRWSRRWGTSPRANRCASAWGRGGRFIGSA